jgi:nitrous oxide reductase
MTVDQNEATTNLPSRRAFLTRVALLGVAAVMTFGLAETEAKADSAHIEA